EPDVARRPHQAARGRKDCDESPVATATAGQKERPASAEVPPPDRDPVPSREDIATGTGELRTVVTHEFQRLDGFEPDHLAHRLADRAGNPLNITHGELLMHRQRDQVRPPRARAGKARRGKHRMRRRPEIEATDSVTLQALEEAPLALRQDGKREWRVTVA